MSSLPKFSYISAFIGCILIFVGFCGLAITWSGLSSRLPPIKNIATYPYIKTVTFVAGAPFSYQVSATFFIPRQPILYQSEIVYASITPYSSLPSFLTPEPQQTTINTYQSLPHIPEALDIQLSASSFDVNPQKQDMQTYDGYKELDFGWTITPKYPGPQKLLFTITELFHNDASASTKSSVLYSSNVPVQILDVPTTTTPSATRTSSNDASQTSQSTNTPFFSIGQITISELMVILIGSVLNIPWIVERWEKKRKQKDKSEHDDIHNSSNISTKPEDYHKVTLPPGSSSPPSTRPTKKRANKSKQRSTADHQRGKSQHP